MHVTIVGGSLAGLTLALACADSGITACVLEKARGTPRRGGTLAVNRELLLKVVGKNVLPDGAGRPFPVLASRRMALGWQDLYRWLRTEAQRHTTVILEDGVSVVRINQDQDGVTAVAAGLQTFSPSNARGWFKHCGYQG